MAGWFGAKDPSVRSGSAAALLSGQMLKRALDVDIRAIKPFSRAEGFTPEEQKA